MRVEGGKRGRGRAKGEVPLTFVRILHSDIHRKEPKGIEKERGTERETYRQDRQRDRDRER